MATDDAQTTAWGDPKAMPPIGGDDLDSWRAARARLVAAATRFGWSRTAASERTGVPLGTLSAWIDGTYRGNYPAQTARVLSGLDAVEEQTAASAHMPAPSAYLETRSAREITATLVYAQTAAEMVTITAAAGVGKTTACRNYAATRPHAVRVVMNASTGNKHAMLKRIATGLGVIERDPSRLLDAVGDRLQRNGRSPILMVDEGQWLADDAVNLLRYFMDEHGAGIALLGNEEVAAKWGRDPRPGQGQVHSRIGKKLTLREPYPEDVEVILDAWGVGDQEIRKLGHAIAHRPGALRQLDKVLRLAWTLAGGAGQSLTADHVRAACANRFGEVIR